VASRPGEVLLGAAATASADGHGLGELLSELALPPDDSRRAAIVGVTTLAEMTARRVEYVEIGFDAGVRAVADPTLGRDEPAVQSAVVTAAALAPPEPDDAVLDRVLGWSTLNLDRHRLRDRLRELRINPWAGAAGDGAALRLAAGRAALGRLMDATEGMHSTAAPDLVVAGGGAWAVAPGPVVTLALADVLRRPGATQYAYDHARLLGPLGSIADPDERRSVLADLADDLLVPLGSVITPAGLRHGRSVGRLVLHADSGGYGAGPRAGRPRAGGPRAGPDRDRRLPFPRLGPAGRQGPPVRGRGRRWPRWAARGPPRRPPQAPRATRSPARATGGVAGVAVGGSRSMTDRAIAANGLGLDLVTVRPLLEEAIDVRFALAPGDRVIVEDGASVTVGAPLAERFRDTVLTEASLPEGTEGRPGARWTPPEPGVAAPAALSAGARAGAVGASCSFRGGTAGGSPVASTASRLIRP
jgi:hypothetical protein